MFTMILDHRLLLLTLMVGDPGSAQASLALSRLLAEGAVLQRGVVVWSDAVPEPVAVRYAWADNPEGANLYNAESLPAAPFRTDSW